MSSTIADRRFNMFLLGVFADAMDAIDAFPGRSAGSPDLCRGRRCAGRRCHRGNVGPCDACGACESGNGDAKQLKAARGSPVQDRGVPRREGESRWTSDGPTAARERGACQIASRHRCRGRQADHVCREQLLAARPVYPIRDIRRNGPRRAPFQRHGRSSCARDFWVSSRCSFYSAS